MYKLWCQRPTVVTGKPLACSTEKALLWEPKWPVHKDGSLARGQRGLQVFPPTDLDQPPQGPCPEP